jgi:hypothetical protein
MSNNIGRLKSILSKHISDATVERILIKAGTKVKDDIISLAPIDTGTYRSSINLSEVSHNGTKHRIKIYTNLDSGWRGIPLGCLLEWGTGIKGEQSNSYSHGYPYRQTPWVYFNEKYGRWVVTRGNIAQPHFIPGLFNNTTYFKKCIKEEISK